jgi:hypothetical protein
MPGALIIFNVVRRIAIERSIRYVNQPTKSLAQKCTEDVNVSEKHTCFLEIEERETKKMLTG